MIKLIKFNIISIITTIISLICILFINKTDKISIMINNNIFPDKYMYKYYSLVFLLIFNIVLYTLKKLLNNYQNIKHMIIWNKILLVWQLSSMFIIISLNIFIPFMNIITITSLSLFISTILFYYNFLYTKYRIVKIINIFTNSENHVYMKFQNMYITIWVYLSFILFISSLFLSLISYLQLVIILYLLDIILKNIYLMNKNRSISRVTSVTILRHGQTEANNLDLIQGITDNPLNETGKKQALETANKIGSNYNCFITSPLKRAYETLDIVCTNKKIFKPIRSSELCIERNFGVLENIKRDPKIENFFGDYSGYIDNKLIEGFESNEKLIKRSKKFFKYLNKYYNSNNILIVSHAHFIKALLTSNTNTNYFDYNIPNCSITNFEIANNNFDLINTDLEKK